ncbi:O-acetylserine dependent cystathionine beta-synthase [Pseudidiomarina piscicola]|uniref:cysteine synthase n=1 Tax=Pseudidiomarina piscicola TaxID=2614830 RepID=A0A776EPU3_9GAMM|nr:cysteine synthase A [Pseudidiomarina piscicola]CAB0151596.1 O-acetylserine dependent cystathionine beta-synthase [Pseudidiomarina piscicola]VZT41061.1 O-acetylserine dependent cystathionine beta-synthase [Pseudomonas aeruginosa]
MRNAQRPTDLIGQTDMIRVRSLSELTGCDIWLKLESQNPGGSIKDRAAYQIIKDALDSGELEPGMTVVEGTAGNTGIGLALVARSFGLNMLAVMPNDQSPEKERMIRLHGAKCQTVDPVPFRNENHFYHTAQRLAEGRDDFWWANQFENTSNARAHYLGTGPEIWQQTEGAVDILVSVAGTGGTIAGTSMYLKERNDDVQVWLTDPDGSGIYSYLQTGDYVANGGSFTEGIGIMRLVENFKQARIDAAVNLPDQDLYALSRYVRDHDGIVLGSSSALNLAGALQAAAVHGPGKTIVTFACDLGERSASKLYNETYLRERGIELAAEPAKELVARYRENGERVWRAAK